MPDVNNTDAVSRQSQTAGPLVAIKRGAGGGGATSRLDAKTKSHERRSRAFRAIPDLEQRFNHCYAVASWDGRRRNSFLKTRTKREGDLCTAGAGSTNAIR